MAPNYEHDPGRGENQPIEASPASYSPDMGSAGLQLTASLLDTSTALVALCSDVGQVTALIQTMLSSLDDALRDFRQIDDPHARNAASETRSAQSLLDEAGRVWLSEYVRRSQDLRNRIMS